MIYLDHAAATPVNPKALQAMAPFFDELFFNPSAPYLPAKHVREAYEQAKNEVAHTIGAKGVDLVITAGATESINLAFTVTSGKVLTLSTEHAAVLAAAKQQEYELIEVDKNGLINLADFRKKLDDQVELVSISLANNELGTIQSLAEIAEIIRQARQQRLQAGNSRPLYLHSDASQALSLLDINVARLGVDLLTINAAKCGGPKGVGALYLGHNVKLQPITVGGGQERGLRSGTENVPGVIGFAAAAREAKTHLSSHRKQYQKMADIIRQELSNLSQLPRELSNPQKPLPNTKNLPENPTKSSVPDQNPAPYPSIISQSSGEVNTKPLPSFPQGSKFPEPIFLGNPKHQLANFLPVCFPGLDAERLIYRLEQRGVLVSTGAACAANKGSKSHVLAAIGLTDSEIAGSLRISLGSTNTIANITAAAKIIHEEVAREYLRMQHLPTPDIAAPINPEDTTCTI